MKATEEERDLWQRILIARRDVDRAVEKLDEATKKFADFKEKQISEEEGLAMDNGLHIPKS